MRGSAEVIERCRRLEGGGLRTFVEDPPMTWERAEGWWVEDADGRRYLDLYGGFAVAAIGHRHPAVVAAIREQAGVLLHAPSAHPTGVRAGFMEALASIVPPGLDRILPAVTGAMANEIALSLARSIHPGRPVFTFDGSYFGRTPDVVGLAGKARYREALGIPPGGRFLPYPYLHRMGPDALARTLEALSATIQDAGPPAAVIVEPVQGNGGVVIPPQGFLSGLREACDRTGALLIFDEIQSGCGRTGRLWASEHEGVEPDIMTVGKGIGGGLPVAAVLGRAAVMGWEPDTYTSTFLTNPVTLAAATAAIGVLRDQGLAERAARAGPAMLEALRQRLEGVPGVADVRGIGLWAGVEIEDADGRADPTAAARAVRRAREDGVVAGRGGHGDNVVKLSPPLVIEEDVLDEGVQTVAGAIRHVMEGVRA